MRKLITMTALAAMMSTPAFAWSVVGGGTGAIGSSAVGGTNSSASAATIGGAETSFGEGGLSYSGAGIAGVHGQTLEGSYSAGSATKGGSYYAGSTAGGASGGFGLY